MAASPSLHVSIKQAAAGGVRVRAEVNISAAAVSTPLWAVLRCDRAQKKVQNEETKDKNKMISDLDQVGFYQTFHSGFSSGVPQGSVIAPPLIWARLHSHFVSSSLGQVARPVPAAEVKSKEEKPRQNQRESSVDVYADVAFR